MILVEACYPPPLHPQEITVSNPLIHPWRTLS